MTRRSFGAAKMCQIMGRRGREKRKGKKEQETLKLSKNLQNC
jgi:hypothetical protein